MKALAPAKAAEARMQNARLRARGTRQNPRRSMVGFILFDYGMMVAQIQPLKA